MSGPEIIDHYTLPLGVVIRTCRESDLPRLEWFGMFSPHRELIRDAFRRQKLGEVVMLVALVNGFPVGQVWIDFARHEPDSVGSIWALRVLPVFHGKGIGTRLLDAAEAVIRARGISTAEIGVEKNNPRARRLYVRAGYQLDREEYDEYEYTTPDDEWVRTTVDQWILRKEIPTEQTENVGSEKSE